MKLFSFLLILSFSNPGFTKVASIAEQLLPIMRGLDSIHTEGKGTESVLAGSWRRPHFPTTLTVYMPKVAADGKQIEFNIESRSAHLFLQMRSLVDDISRDVSASEDSLAFRPSVFPSSRHTQAGFVGNMKVRVPNTPAGRQFSSAFLKQFREISENF